MYIRFRKGEQFRLLKSAIKIAGSQRALSKILGISNQKISEFASKERTLNENHFNKLVAFVGIKDSESLIEERLQNNWRQILGGKNCVISKKNNGTFDRDMKVLQKIQSRKLKKWHRDMRKNSPEEYYLIQYSRFKKIGNYKDLTLRGEKVRNELERDVADILFKNGINYEYEPLIRMGDNFFFPDFVINDKIIIECTMWRGVEKAYKLKNKIDILKSKYRIFVIIPKNLYSYYLILKDNLILGLDEFAPIAQTFNREIEKGATGRATDC